MQHTKVATDLPVALDASGVGDDKGQDFRMMELMAAVIAGIWALSCAWCGFAKRLAFFCAELAFGIAVVMGYLVITLDQPAFNGNAITLYISIVMLALCCFATGWLVRRFRRNFLESQSEE